MKKLLLALIITVTASAQYILVLNPTTGQLDMAGATVGGSGGTNGVLYGDSSGNIQRTATGGAGTLCLVSVDGAAPSFGSCAGSAATAFSAITTSTNTSATMTVGAGGSVTFTSTGIVNASQANGVSFGSTTATAGNVLIGSGTTWVTQAVSGDITINSSGLTAIGATKVTNAMLAGSIAATKLVGTDINTVGTITTGTWSATTIALNKGGTGQTTQQAAFDALAPTATRAGDLTYWNGTHYVNIAGNNAGTKVLQEDSSGVPTWVSAGAGTVTVVGAGNLTSTYCVSGGGSQTIQTPSSACTIDASGNIVANSITAAGGVSTGTSPPSLTAGTGGVWGAAEGTVPSVCAAASVDCLYFDSTQHGPLLSRNNGSYLPLPQGPASTTSGDLASWNSTNGGLLADSGVVAANVTTATGTLTSTQLICGSGSKAMAVCNLSGDATTSSSAVVTVAKVNGIAYSATAAAHSVEVITTANTTATAKTLPDCIDTAGNHLNFTQSTDAFSCGTSSSGGGGSAGATLFSTTGSTTVTATSATTLIGTATGSTTISANTFTAGQVLHVSAQGYYSTPATPASLTIDLKIGGTTRITTGAVVQIASVTNGVWNMTCDITTRTTGGSGTQIANCIFVGTGSTLTPGEAPMFTSSAWTVDTTATNAIDIQATWSTATGSPTITSTNVSAWIPGAPVSSFSGDGTFISNSGSTGAITATLATAAAHKAWMNNTGSTAAPGYQSIGTADLPVALANQTSINGLGITASTGTLTVTNGKTAAFSNTLTFTGTDSSSVALGAGGTVTYTIASGTSALGTGSISANSCASVVTTSATGTAATDTITWAPNADISAVTGYGVLSTDGLKVFPYPTTNNVNWKVCNGTGTAITPGAVTLNWRILR